MLSALTPLIFNQQPNLFKHCVLSIRQLRDYKISGTDHEKYKWPFLY